MVREFEGAQAYVDAGFCEWIDDAPAEISGGPTEVVVDRTQTVETTDAAGGEVETTSTRVAPHAMAGRPGGATPGRRRGHAAADD